MVALETPTPFLGMGAGEEVNSVKGAAKLGNSQSKEEGTGEGGRKQRSEEGKEEENRVRVGDGSFSLRFPPSDETLAPSSPARY